MAKTHLRVWLRLWFPDKLPCLPPHLSLVLVLVLIWSAVHQFRDLLKAAKLWWNCSISENQDKRLVSDMFILVKVRKNLWRSSGRTPLLKQGHQKPIAQEHIQNASEYLQEGSSSPIMPRIMVFYFIISFLGVKWIHVKLTDRWYIAPLKGMSTWPSGFMRNALNICRNFQIWDSHKLGFSSHGNV